MKIFLSVILASLPAAANAQPMTPQSTMGDLVSGALTAVKLPTKMQMLKGNGNVRGFCDLVQSGFDFENIARALVPGNIWEAATPEQQKEYVRAVVSHMANVAGLSFQQLGGKSLNLEYRDLPPMGHLPTLGIKDRGNQFDGFVVLRPMADSTYRVYDIGFGGNTMLFVKQSDFRSTAVKGLPVLTQALNTMSSTRMLQGTCEDRHVTASLETLPSGARLRHEINALVGPGRSGPVPHSSIFF